MCNKKITRKEHFKTHTHNSHELECCLTNKKSVSLVGGQFSLRIKWVRVRIGKNDQSGKCKEQKANG